MSRSPATAVYVLDIGPVGSPDDHPRLGWAGHRGGTPIATGHDASLEDLADHVSQDLRDGVQVALGFEAPGWVPVPAEEHRLLRARGEADTAPGGHRSAWCGRHAVWGTARLLALGPWVLSRVSDDLGPTASSTATLDLHQWMRATASLLLFEAYVAGDAKPAVPTAHSGNLHAVDARSAVEAFGRALADGPHDDTELTTTPVEAGDGTPFSLLGAMLLHAGLSDDLRMLRNAPVLVRPERPTRPTTSV